MGPCGDARHVQVLPGQSSRKGWLGLVPSRTFVVQLLTCPSVGLASLSPPVKEEEKQKLLQRGSELQTEHQQLEERDRQLASAVKVSASGVGPSSPAHRTHRPTGSGCSSDVDHDSLPSIWGHSEAPSSQLGPWQGPAFLNLNFVLYKENIVLCRLIGKG